MANRHKSLYNMYDIRRYMDGNEFKVIVDTANEKYNQAVWKQFGSWDRPSDSRTWSQGEKSIPIYARASLLGPHSRKPLRNTSGWKFYGGSTPKFGHGFGIDEDDLYKLREVKNNTGEPLSNLFYDSLLTNSEDILGGMHNELSHMCLELASTGEIHEQSVDGVNYDFTFEFEQNQFIDCDPKWFDTNGDPVTTSGGKTVNVIKDILATQKMFTEVQHRKVDHWKISKTLLDMILDHPSVLGSYLANRDIQSGNQASFIATQKELLQFMHDRGVWYFHVNDFRTSHEEDGQAVADPPAFDIHNMVAADSSQKMFDIKNTNSIWKDRQSYGGIDPSKMYHFVEGRIAALSKWEEDPISNVVQFELYAGPVFRSLRNYGLLSTWSDT